MLKIRRVLFSLLIVLPSASGVCAQRNAGHPADHFLVNPAHPFVYLRFDHIGPSGENSEPISRMWLWLVNNCQVPIVVRTFGAADDHFKDEIGVMDRVVSNPGPYFLAAGVNAKGEVKEFPSPVEDQGKMPSGYETEVSSTESIPPGRAILFSVPVNHVSKKWHMEIPFEFNLPSGKGFRGPATGGLPSMVLEYGLWDLPPERQTEVLRLIQETLTRK